MRPGRRLSRCLCTFETARPKSKLRWLKVSVISISVMHFVRRRINVMPSEQCARQIARGNRFCRATIGRGINRNPSGLYQVILYVRVEGPGRARCCYTTEYGDDRFRRCELPSGQRAEDAKSPRKRPLQTIKCRF